MRVARSRVLVAEGYALATVARVMQVSRQALYRVPHPRRAPARRPPADGAVEAEAEGDAGALAKFEAWLHHGPGYAEVESVEAEPLPGEPRYRGFSIG